MKHFTEISNENNIDIVTLSNDFIEAKIAINIGCTLYSLTYKNQDVIYFNDNLQHYAHHQKLAGNPFMHPWSNRLNGDLILGKYFQCNNIIDDFLYRDANQLPLHGLILKSNKWKINNVKSDDNSSKLSTYFLFDDKNMLSIFPYQHKIFLDIILSNDCLTYQVEIKCLETDEMPVAFGFHPYFNLQHSRLNYLQIPNCKIALVDNKMIPTNEYISPNNLFNFQFGKLDFKNHNIDHAFIHDDNSKNYILETEKYTIEFLLDNNYKVVQIYHPNTINKPYICIEPMLAKANALNENNYPTTKNGKFSAEFSMKFY